MKARYWLGLAILSAGLAILGLRVNAQQSLELKNRIIEQDLAGANVEVQIEQLRQFVFSHMNSSVEFELLGAYQRTVTAAEQAGVSGELYAQAQAQCDRQGDSSVVQAQCVQTFLEQRVNPAISTVRPLRSQFSYAFAAPSWSPDLAGWGILGALVALIGGVIAYIRQQFSLRAI